MADSTQVFPQIPSTVWWGIRDQFKKSIPPKVSEQYLAAHLNVQGTAARQYIGELKRAGILDADGKPTEAVKQWRLDDSYADAARQILEAVYPDELINLAPPEEADRAKAIRWFMGTAHLGQGAANNKAATYFLIGSKAPPLDVPVSKAEKKPRAAKKQAKQETTRVASTAPAPVDPPNVGGEPPASGSGGTSYPLNVNVQIHISADASSDQIEAIFANMRKYLHS